MTTDRLLRAFLVLTSLICGTAVAGVVTNKDIIKLLEAGMPEDVIVNAIANGEPKFDTSADALVKLKAKGASPAILNAVIAPNAKIEKRSTPSVTSAPSVPSAASGKLNPEEVILAVDGREETMQYMIPTMRTAARALGFGGVASYAVLPGEKAQRRLTTTSPEFIISVPKNAQPINYLTLANFAVRNNGTREVSTGGGFISYSTGIHRDRVVATVAEVLPDQNRAKEGFVLYRIKTEQPMASGEYALVLYTAEVRISGFFSQNANSFFDFGVD